MLRHSIPKKQTGFALVLAITISIICFFIATAVIATSRFDLRAATGSASQLRNYFAARGQVQDLLARVQSGANTLEDFPADQPFEQEIDGVTVKAWAVNESPGVYRVYAVAGDQRSESVVSLNAGAVAGAFTSILFDPSGIDPTSYGTPTHFLTQAGPDSWALLPDPPKYIHTSRGTSTDNVTVSRHYVADDDGHLFISTTSYSPAGVGLFKYEPSTHNWQDLGRVPAFEWDVDDVGLGGVATRLGHNDGEEWVVSRSGGALFDRVNFGPWNYLENTKKTDIYSMIRKLDTSTGRWTAVHGPGPGKLLGAMAGGKDDSLVGVVIDGTNPPGNQLGILNGSHWDMMAPAPISNIQSVAVGPDGEIYAAGGFNALQVAKFTADKGWESVTAPPGAPAYGGGQKPTVISVDSEGALVCRSGSDQSYSRLEEGGEWTPMPEVEAPGKDQAPWSVVGAGAVGGESGSLLQTVSH